MIAFLRSHRCLLAVLATLLAATLGTCALLWYRIDQTGSMTYLWLVRPNLLLAWIPLLCALWVTFRWYLRRTITIDMGLAGVLWLLFYPNAPYVVTDIAHITKFRQNFPVQLDVLLHVVASFTSVMVGFLSLILIQSVAGASALRKWWTEWLFVVAVLCLSSLGVFLGRFLRWNSWDMLRQPVEIGKDALAALQQPDSLVFIGSFLLFQACGYFVVFSLMQLRLK